MKLGKFFRTYIFTASSKTIFVPASNRAVLMSCTGGFFLTEGGDWGGVCREILVSRAVLTSE